MIGGGALRASRTLWGPRGGGVGTHPPWTMTPMSKVVYLGGPPTSPTSRTPATHSLARTPSTLTLPVSKEDAAFEEGVGGPPGHPLHPRYQVRLDPLAAKLRQQRWGEEDGLGQRSHQQVGRPGGPSPILTSPPTPVASTHLPCKLATTSPAPPPPTASPDPSGQQHPPPARACRNQSCHQCRRSHPRVSPPAVRNQNRGVGRDARGTMGGLAGRWSPAAGGRLDRQRYRAKGLM